MLKYSVAPPARIESVLEEDERLFSERSEVVKRRMHFFRVPAGGYFLVCVGVVFKLGVDCKALRNGNQQIFRSEIVGCKLVLF
jgi:hypothetical protein